MTKDYILKIMLVYEIVIISCIYFLGKIKDSHGMYFENATLRRIFFCFVLKQKCSKYTTSIKGNSS